MFYRDSSEKKHTFEPIAGVEFKGEVTKGGQSSGHYYCYVKDHASRKWIKTSDEMEPEEIDVAEVSQCIYVTLFKKAHSE